MSVGRFLQSRTVLLPGFAILLSIVLGAGVAIVSSPISIGPGASLPSNGNGTVSGSRLDSPSPGSTSSPTSASSPLAAPGRMGASPEFVASGSTVAVSNGKLAELSLDSGLTWSQIKLPADTTSLAVDAVQPTLMLAGGNQLMVSFDSGKTWAPPASQPTNGAGPFEPLMVSPFDGSVWFVAHNAHLGRTLTTGSDWRDLVGVGDTTSGVMSAGITSGDFFLAHGNAVFELANSGASVASRRPLASGLTVLQLSVSGGSAQTLFARASDRKVYSDRGAGWQSSGAAVGGPVTANNSGLVLIGDGGAALGKPAEIDYSNDGGLTWAKGSGLPADETVEALAYASDTGHAYAYLYGGDVYGSSDQGHSWQVISTTLRG